MPRSAFWTGSTHRLILVAIVIAALAGCTIDLRDNPPHISGDLVVNGQINAAAIEAEHERIDALSEDDLLAEAATLDAVVERELWTWSGVERAVGGPEAADAAFLAAAQSLAAFTAGIKIELADLASTRSNTVSTAETASNLHRRRLMLVADAPNLGMAWFGGLITVKMLPEGLVGGTNDVADGPARSGAISEGISGTISRDAVNGELSYSDEQGGVTTSLRVKFKVNPCPDAQGRFQATALIEMSATAKGGSVGQKGTVEVLTSGQLDDDAQVASSEYDYRMEVADFAGGKGSYVDLSAAKVGTSASTHRINRSAGPDSAALGELVRLAAMLASTTHDSLIDAARKGWESGRCVSLQVTAAPGPSGLKPSSEAKISAKPRSRIDGGPTGGTVTAQLASGGASVSPSGTKVKADATFSYTAPSEYDKSGTVELEARSKRGVAKASITLDTKRGAYIASGGSKVSISGKIPDLAQPFTLSGVGDGFTVVFSYTPTNDRSGTVTYSGSGSGANMSGAGRYSISGEDPVLTLTQTHGGCVDIGTCATNTDVITLTREGG